MTHKVFHVYANLKRIKIRLAYLASKFKYFRKIYLKFSSDIEIHYSNEFSI